MRSSISACEEFSENRSRRSLRHESPVIRTYLCSIEHRPRGRSGSENSESRSPFRRESHDPCRKGPLPAAALGSEDREGKGAIPARSPKADGRTGSGQADDVSGRGPRDGASAGWEEGIRTCCGPSQAAAGAGFPPAGTGGAAAPESGGGGAKQGSRPVAGRRAETLACAVESGREKSKRHSPHARFFTREETTSPGRRSPPGLFSEFLPWLLLPGTPGEKGR